MEKVVEKEILTIVANKKNVSGPADFFIIRVKLRLVAGCSFPCSSVGMRSFFLDQIPLKSGTADLI